MKKIVFYKLNPPGAVAEFRAPAGAEIVDAEYDPKDGGIAIRAVVDDREPEVAYFIRLLCDGEEVRSGRHVASIMTPGGKLHLFM